MLVLINTVKQDRVNGGEYKNMKKSRNKRI